MTKLYGVVGDPVIHSLSPVIHNAWIREHGLDATYEALHIPNGEFSDGMASLEARKAMGLNVTSPHKEAAIARAESTSEVARRVGAANTLIRLKSGGWLAENTDAPGFTEALVRSGVDVAGRNVCLLGAGGAARAVALALSDLGATLTICNRTRSRVEELVKHVNIKADICSLGQVDAEMAKADVVVNTLSLGMTGQSLDLPEGKQRTFYDISYGKPAKAMLKQAKTAGWTPLDGLSMLVAQAAFSFEHWFGILPDMDSSLARCRKLVEATT